MKRTFYLTSLLLILTITLINCKKEEDRVDKNLLGKWKCIGFGNTETNKIIPIEPQDCESCFVITFKEKEDHGICKGTSGLASIGFKYYNKSNKIILLHDYIGTDVGDIGDGFKFRDIFIKQNNHYKIEGDKLFIYYSQTEYLLFNLRNR